MKKTNPTTKFPSPKSSEPHPFRINASFWGCIASGALLGIMVIALFNAETGIPKVQEVILIKEQLVKEIEQLQADNARILKQIEAIQTDPFWQEKIAREELNMALPGEIIYKFTE